MADVTKKIVFKGRVQGVGFRFTAYNIANRNQLTGQVRNLPDGSVEMIAQGQQQDIDDCIRDLQDSFMGGAIEVQTEDYPAGKSFTEFKITF